MELKDFIKETIASICQAIDESNSELGKIGAVVNPRVVAGANADSVNLYGYMSLPHEDRSKKRRPVHSVDFDVAVTADDKTGSNGGIGIMVAAIGLGSQGHTDHENAVVSRLTFRVPVALPTGDENAQQGA